MEAIGKFQNIEKLHKIKNQTTHTTLTAKSQKKPKTKMQAKQEIFKKINNIKTAKIKKVSILILANFRFMIIIFMEVKTTR